MDVVRRDEGYSWVICVSSMVNLMINDGTVTYFGVVLKDMAEDLSVQPSDLAVVGAIFVGMFNVIGPVVTILIDALDCRKVLLIGNVLSIVSIITTSLTTSSKGTSSPADKISGRF